MPLFVETSGLVRTNARLGPAKCGLMPSLSLPKVLMVVREPSRLSSGQGVGSMESIWTLTLRVSVEKKHPKGL